MAEVSITAVCVLNNPAAFTDPIVLEVQYECLSSLQEDLEWRVTYVGSAESDAYDQVLDSALVGPIQPGAFKFRMEAPPPDPSKCDTMASCDTHARACYCVDAITELGSADS
jgi:histone chaperone ASF1